MLNCFEYLYYDSLLHMYLENANDIYYGLLLVQGMRIPFYDDELLHLAEDLGRRMLPVFDTPTGTVSGLHCLLISA